MNLQRTQGSARRMTRTERTFFIKIGYAWVL
jgi:hypothetical protein